MFKGVFTPRFMIARKFVPFPVLILLVPFLLVGCFKWDVRINYLSMDSKPAVSSTLVTESMALQSGYFDSLLKELNKRKIAIDVKKMVRRYKGKNVDLSSVSWRYQGLEFSKTECTRSWFSKTCKVSFSQWVNPEKFPEFQWEPPTFTLTVVMPKKSYKGSNAHSVSDQGSNKILRWNYRNIKPRQTVQFEYEYTS